MADRGVLVVTVAFDAYRANPEIREAVRGGAIKGMESHFEKTKEPIIHEISGNNPKAQLKAAGGVEEAALETIEKAICRAYSEAAIDLKMSQY